MSVFVDRAGRAVPGLRRPAGPGPARTAPARPSKLVVYRRWNELAEVLGWSAAEIAGVCRVRPATVCRGLAIARAAGREAGGPHPQGPPRLSAAEVRYVEATYGDDPDVRAWLVAAGLA